MRNLDYVALENEIMNLIAQKQIPIAVASLIVEKINNNIKTQLNNVLMYEQMQEEQEKKDDSKGTE